ncbi:MAG: LLM class flavin-dependent oxidoreductase, partial [Paracoccaceae bacterium]|nr:LLM class flavin-dependent oxidoreductase [Paracoccaceae bacterium]
MSSPIELGLDTFGDVSLGPDGRLKPQDQVLRDVVDQAVLADSLGIHFIGLGEHHRADFAISAPEIVLAAIASRTSRIRLGTAVTVLSSDDPVRVFQRFSTLNALSNGRAEVILGRGSFTESFPLFGYDLSDYETLFEEKLDLFLRLVREEKVSWQGSTRAGLKGQAVFPRLAQPLPVWVGVGGSPESVVRAVVQDVQMMLAIIGGPSARFRPHVDLYHRACAQIGNAPRPLGVHSPGHVAETDAEARDQLWPHYQKLHARIGAERGWSPMTRAQFDAEADHGALYVGSPETVAQKIADTVKTLGLARFDLKYASGPMPHDVLMRSIALYGREVIPRVQALLG